MRRASLRVPGLGWGHLSILLLAFAFAYPMQVNGWNQNAHYALVRALADGTPAIDRSRREIGDLGTGDISRYRGHDYSNKAPGLAFATLPAFAVAASLGMRTTGDPTRVIWALHLWSIVLPAFLLLLLVRWAADLVEPGFGTLAAASLGLGTLVLPFATLFFAHVLAAALAFGAFAVLVHERRRPPRLALVGAAGLLAGLGVTVEYPVALAGVVLGAYALARPDRVRRGLVYAACALAGTAPLLLYNQWAFDSPTHLSYERNQVEPLEGFFGFAFPRAGAAFDLLFSGWGLLTVTPVVAAGLVGAVLLFRRGWRAEALVLVAVPVLQFAYDAGLRFSPFGGLGYPRYLIYVLPFLAVPLAAAWRAFPLTTASLLVVSGFQMAVVTATNPLAAYDGDWLDRLQTRTFSTTAASIVGVTGWYAIAPFFAVVVLAAVCAALDCGPLRARVLDVLAVAVALSAWGAVAVASRNPSGSDFGTGYVLALALVVAAAAGGVAVALHAASSRRLTPAQQI